MLILVFCLSSSILIGRLFYLQIVKGEDYLQNYELSIRRTSTIQGTRGNIYDRNGELLAYNKLAYSVTNMFLEKVVRVFRKGRTCFPESFHRKQKRMLKFTRNPTLTKC